MLEESRANVGVEKLGVCKRCEKKLRLKISMQELTR
jgi:hypothetical protein